VLELRKHENALRMSLDNDGLRRRRWSSFERSGGRSILARKRKLLTPQAEIIVRREKCSMFNRLRRACGPQ
jgi:hypothetical protein